MQHKSFWTAVILSVIILSCKNNKPGMVQPVEPGKWIQTWMLCGPFDLEKVNVFDYLDKHLPGFDTDYLTMHGGEANPIIKEKQTETCRGQSVSWFLYTTKDSTVHLSGIFPEKEFAMAYGYCEVESSSDKFYFLSVGSDDGIQVWVNGTEIWNIAAKRNSGRYPDLIPVSLHKGENTVLVKAENLDRGWEFRVRFLPFDARELADQYKALKIIWKEDGRPFLKVDYPQGVINQIFKSGKIKVFKETDAVHPVYNSEWAKVNEMPMPYDSSVFEKYIVVFNSILNNGQEMELKLPFSSGRYENYVLFSKGKSDYSIVIDEKASESEQWAAQELQHWIEESGGVKIPILKKVKTGHSIYIGYNSCLSVLKDTAFHKPAEEDESFTYKNAGPDILIWGGSRRGTMYGVFSFLEKELGVRWYTSRVSVVPKKEQFAFHYLYNAEAPQVRVRNDFYFEAFEPVWAARNKVNGAMSNREQHGGVERYWGVHTFYRFVQPEKYFKTHPEYYSMIDGKRTCEFAQLCLTNPDVLKITIESLKETIHENPGYLIYDVSQNDCLNPCQCEKCQQIVKKEGSESGLTVWFVNQVAEQIEKEFPGIYVGTLAYNYTRKPCKTMRPRHNVVIRLCPIECCYSHPLKSCQENKSFMEDIKGWSKIAPHLYIWDYVVDFAHYMMPFPNFNVLQSNIQMFLENKAIGIMEQAAYQSRGGEFAELRSYVIAKLLWDPYCNVDSVINDFIYGYYGRSGQYIRQYFDLLHNRVTKDIHIRIYIDPSFELYTNEFIQQSEKIFDRAESVADNDSILRRVEMARLPIMYLKYRRLSDVTKFDGTLDRMMKIIKREGITRYAEGELGSVNDGYFGR